MTGTAEAMVRTLFSIIDAQRWDRLGEVLAVDAVYRRPGFPEMRGLARIDRFYRGERVIASGTHTIDSLLCHGAAAACWGHLDGTLVDGRSVLLEFADVYGMNGDRILTRTSYFFAPLA